MGNAKRCPRQAGRCAQRIVHKCTALQAPSGASPAAVCSPRGRRARSQLARYGQAFKDRAVGRLLPPHSATPDELAREIGVSASTLERWRADALAQPARERHWTAAARLDAVLTTAAMDEAAKSAWCREHGVYLQDLAHWRQAATAALAEPEEARATPQATRADRRRIKELERDLRRKDRALAETAALLVLSKKLEAILPGDEDE